jgi:hypothetical protein
MKYLATLKTPGFATPLQLARAPLFLRFVRSAAGDWDALDLHSDTPRPGETIVAARLKNKSTVHVDGTRNGRRFGETYFTRDYEPVADPPSLDVLTDTERWQSWCLEQPANEPPLV